jgi:hypothetical protein
LRKSVCDWLRKMEKMGPFGQDDDLELLAGEKRRLLV